ncbi:hypothetical protein GCM10027511_41860 [Hymenobacter humi]
MNLAETLSAAPAPGLPTPEANPFVRDDLLVESDLQKVVWDLAADRCALLLDLKGSFQYPEANTAIIVATGISRLDWTGRSEERRGRWGTLIVGSSTFSVGSDGFRLSIGAIDSQRIEIVADELRFWEGNVPGADDAPPDYDEDSDEVIRAGLTSWDSEFVPISSDSRPTPT